MTLLWPSAAVQIAALPQGSFSSAWFSGALPVTASPGGCSMNAPLIALTGATGFIGRHLLAELPKRGYRVRVLLRRPSEVPAGRVERRDRRHRLAAQHGGGFARRGHGDPLGGPRPRHVGPAGGRLPHHQHGGDDQARPGGRAGRREALRVPVLDPRAERPGGRGHPDRSRGAAAHRRLWPLEARGRAGPRRARPRLGGAAPGARLRARREGQHGGAAGPGAIALAAAARRLEREALASLPRQPRLRRSTRC